MHVAALPLCQTFASEEKESLFAHTRCPLLEKQHIQKRICALGALPKKVVIYQ